MNELWLDALLDCRRNNIPCVLATVIDTKGSTPRENGSKILVTANSQFDSIGGGHLEFRTVELSRNLLQNPEERTRLVEFPLGPALGQCCGGYVSILLESFSVNEPEIFLFGAGHVAEALTDILYKLPVRLRWIDNRETIESLSSGKKEFVQISDDPVDDVESAPAGAFFLIMTHDHSLDFRIIEALVKRADFRYCGLIGSSSKSVRFRKRLMQRGYAQTIIDRLKCPVGLHDVGGKKPMEVAVSIAADIISVYQSEHLLDKSNTTKRATVNTL